MADFNSIPKVNLHQFIHGSSNEKDAFVQQIGRAFRQVGFVIVKNHGIPKDVVADFYQASMQFFALPENVKRKYEYQGLAGQRGYTSFGKEHAKQSQAGDLKEFYQFGQIAGYSDTQREGYPPNVLVREIPAFYHKATELYRAFETSGGYLLQAVALYLGLDEHFFDPFITKGNSILRSIYYPPITSEPKSAIRSEQHEDINLITLLVGASAGGLQVKNLQGDWIPVIPEEDEISINVGDMLQRLTNKYLISTTHRVINPPKESWHTDRLSIPFFLHPVSSMDLSALSHCVTEENPIHFEPITAGEYLDERLAEIGLKTGK